MENNVKQDAPVITGILIQDPEDQGFTAYFAEFPEVIAEGNTEKEAKSNLIHALKVMLEIKRSEMPSDGHNHGKVSSFAYPLDLVS